MKVLQLVALWIATVSLVVIAVFTTLNYFDTDEAEEAHRVAEVAHWESFDAWACSHAFIGILGSMEGWQWFRGTWEWSELVDQVRLTRDRCIMYFGEEPATTTVPSP